MTTTIRQPIMALALLMFNFGVIQLVKADTPIPKPAAGDISHGSNAVSKLDEPAAKSPTEPIPAARAGHTAILLADGRVLVAGGQSIVGSWLSSAELYDPAKKTWKNTGTLNDGRIGHKATLLSDGKALIAGGNGSGFYLSSAELYDPASGKWRNTGALNDGRIGHTMTLLQNGKVLVVGGVGNNNNDAPIFKTELYDPATGTWTWSGTLNSARAFGETATLLTNGFVLIAGGLDENNRGFSSAELYNPTTGKWKRTGDLNNIRAEHSATLLPNGKVLVAGGDLAVDPQMEIVNDSGKVLVARSDQASAELYDPTTGKWTKTGALSTGRKDHAAFLLSNGKVLVVGGNASNTVEIYNPGTGKWTTGGTLDPKRYGGIPTLLSNGKVLFTGGDVGYRAEIYDPTTEE